MKNLKSRILIMLGFIAGSPGLLANSQANNSTTNVKINKNDSLLISDLVNLEIYDTENAKAYVGILNPDEKKELYLILKTIKVNSKISPVNGHVEFINSKNLNKNQGIDK